MDHSLRHGESYIGQPISSLPTPSFIISKPVLEKNIKKLHDNVSKLGISFRPHTKTLKTLEVTRLMLGEGKYRKVVASTLPEIEGVLPLVQDGILDECLYGFPVAKSVLPRLSKLYQSIKIDLLIDNEHQIDILENFAKTDSSSPSKWQVYIKINVGSNRAGIPSNVPRLHELVKKVEASSVVELRGFYCHAGHSYGCRTREQAESVLEDEINGLLTAVLLLPSDRPLEVSVGATPTAHVVESFRTVLPPNVSLELHAGNFPTNDLQQVSTGLVSESDQAIRVCTEICSVYPERNEALINAGVIALSREASAHPGFGQVCGKPGWNVLRLSQEHGILGKNESESASDKTVCDEFQVGEKVFLYCQHSCITAAAFYVYYVVDKSDTVIATWVPWKGW